jgi:DNA invertase Pin-like site-specific DNA recombinase
MKTHEFATRAGRPGDPRRDDPTGLLSRKEGKVQARHLERLAVVYVRQSSPQQVHEHRESARLQYDLRGRAAALGWPADRVVVIDEDQGRSGKTAAGRPGFQRLLAEVGLDRVGLILGIEMSRLARSCRDWHQLLELCALFHTVLADRDALYDPTDHNDRLLLGLSGIMSEAELHILRGRMLAGARSKARRGELFNHAPIGYARVPGGGLMLDPDEQARDVVRMVFDKFDELGTVSALLKYLVRHGIRLGFRPHFGPDKGGLAWRRPNRTTLTFLLHHPIYAGAYARGRRPTDPRRKVPGRPATGRVVVPMDAWEVLIRDHLPAYITWERYESNLRRLAQNGARAGAMRAAREGESLLAGLVHCGRCGRRMLVAYTSREGRLRHSCQRGALDYAEPACQSLAGGPLDELVARQVLRALEPAALEVGLRAVGDAQAERDRLDRQWRLRVERSRYEAERAARQYQACEPENRMVGRELERRWEQALLEQRRAEEEYERFGRGRPAELTADEIDMLGSLSEDIPALWQAPTTTVLDRQEVVRHLVERVSAAVQGESEWVDVTIHWAGGVLGRPEVRRPGRRVEQLRDYAALMARVAELHDSGKTSGEVAEALNREGFRPPKRRETYNAGMVRQLLSRQGRSGPRPAAATEGDPRGEGEWWLSDLSRELGMPQPTVHCWVRRGWVRGRKLPGVGGRWVLWADAEDLDRLRRLRAYRRSWADEPYPPELTTPSRDRS